MSNSPLTHVNNPSRTNSRPDNTYNVDKGLLLTEVPPPPEMLDSEGRLWWHYYCDLMVRGNVLSQFFLTSITNLCMQHMIAKQLWSDLEKDGLILTKQYFDKQGYLTKEEKSPNPTLGEYQRCVTLMDKFLVSLGMTAYSAKVNSIDTSGGAAKKARAATPPPTPVLFKSEAG